LTSSPSEGRDSSSSTHWLASPRRDEVSGPLGVTNIRTFVDPQNPAQVAVLMDVADMDAVMAAMQTEGMAGAMVTYRTYWNIQEAIEDDPAYDMVKARDADGSVLAFATDTCAFASG
jgi:hypothetical protein